ncbi:MAG: hypothetical protein CL489_05140 [Acidobacteria bacterium]|nr:hypothetical protein [Acidobacteriota bacterium]
MATNPYFNHFSSQADQGLIEDLFIESIKMYGQDMYYISRSLVNEDTLMGDDSYSEFNDARMIEIYIKDVDGFSGETDVISKFGLEIHDEITFTVAVRRFRELGLTVDGRDTIPKEGDLIFFPMVGGLFQIITVADQPYGDIFYQTGALQGFDMKCVLFEYTDQKFNTGIEEIDKLERIHSYTVDFTMGAGSGTYVVDEAVYQGTDYASSAYKAEVAKWDAGTKVLRLMNLTKNFDGTQNIIGVSSEASYAITSFDMQASATDTQASNVEIEAAADAIIDFTEGNPFGSL